MWNEQIFSEAMAISEQLQEHRRWLHAHAEEGFDLNNTKTYVKNQLEQMGYSVSECGKCGLTTLAQGSQPGKVFLLRADMDALPIREESGLDFACSDGRMHACGHDLHTAMLLGAAKLLKNHEHELHGTVKLMFQPAEELLEGAEDMIQHGVLDDPKVDAAMMIHVSTGIAMPAGTVIISAPGVSAPAADYFTIQVHGKGCHGSMPQDGIDPLTASAHILIALQEIMARELGIMDKAVITIGTIQGGDASNVIPDSVTMGGTIRSFDEKLRDHLKKRIQEISTGIAETFRASAEVIFDIGCPSLVNDPVICSKAERYLKELLGSKALAMSHLNSGAAPSAGGSEDFSFISQQVPSLMVALAAGDPKNGYQYPLHHPKTIFDESALPYGCAALTYVAMRYLEDMRTTD